jgi:hypothetical protein
MKNNQYIITFIWMYKDLKLNALQAAVFGLIYGFCQDGKSSYNGSLSYLQDLLQISKPTAQSALKKLTDKQLIKRHDFKNGVKYYLGQAYYNYINLGPINNASGKEILPVSGKEILPVSGKETLPSGKEILPVSGKETLPNNKEYNKLDNKNNNKGVFVSDELTAYEVLKKEKQIGLNQALVKYGKLIDDFDAFIVIFNNKCIIEKLDWEPQILLSRFITLAQNWKSKKNNESGYSLNLVS